MTRKPVIELRDVWKVYQMGEVRVPALRGLNLKIYPKDFVAIIGASGSGKSTLMNMVGSLDVPTKGKVFLDGQDISLMDESTLAQVRGRKIGFVFQQFNLLPNLTAAENVALPMIFQGVPKEERQTRSLELLERVGLLDRATHRPNEMSGGQQQRVAIARALANDPEIILADEPTGNLDSKTGEMVMKLLVNLDKKEGKTLIVITHDKNIAKVAEKRVNLIDGQVSMRG
jgi:putative ABC transport system ATP-binding protein